ncbi:hypothetical protein [Sphingomonas sp. PAMC 26617]|uniref:hypothetical protein n=1 Tax=Sphingomonas sp. PAMC 26617 TaxID=1112216 RepID=UPI0002880166|nr:hypothetical protein [Sphingomonas sp. PAMC 26617]
MFAHVPVSIGVQLACWAIGRALGAPTRASVWIGAFAGSAVCVMREITQREYQWIEQFGAGRRANMPGYAGLEVWQWNTHSLAETAVAIAASVVLAAAVTVRPKP